MLAPPLWSSRNEPALDTMEDGIEMWPKFIVCGAKTRRVTLSEVASRFHLGADPARVLLRRGDYARPDHLQRERLQNEHPRGYVS